MRKLFSSDNIQIYLDCGKCTEFRDGKRVSFYNDKSILKII
jgi:hypothetical protein